MQANTSELLNLIEAMGLPVQHVNPQRRYWFISTQGGNYYSEFKREGFVEISHKEILYSLTPEPIEQIKFNSRYVFPFCNEIKKGDIIIIPSQASKEFQFGQVQEDIYTEHQKMLGPDKYIFTYRRKVKWLQDIKKEELDSKLYSFFCNRKALVNVDSCGEFIDRTLYPFYIKGDIAHLTLEVNTPHSPNAADILLYLSTILTQADELAVELQMQTSTANVQSRINVQSKGIIEFFGEIAPVVTIIHVILFLFGGHVKYDPYNGFSMGTEGLPGLLKAYWRHKENMAEIRRASEAQKRLMIKDIQDNNKDE